MDRPVRELNLELGRPDAAEALRRLAAEVEAAAVAWGRLALAPVTSLVLVLSRLPGKKR